MGVTIRRPAPSSSGALPLRAVGEPTPERPGPGPMPDALLRALDLTIGRRVEGLLAGEHRSRLLGRGTELAQVRPYVLREHVVAAVDDRQRPRRLDQRDRPTRARSVRDQLAQLREAVRGRLARRGGQRDGVADERRVDVDLERRPLQR